MKQEHWLKIIEQIEWISIAQKSAIILLILLLGYFFMHIRYKLIKQVFSVTKLDINKEKSLESLLMSLTRYTIYIISFLLILRQFIDITPIIAGAGIVGVAVGFGAQSLVKDVITGFFVMFEDQYHVGDFVEINNAVTGTVEEIGLRLTTVREWSGKKFYIANSEIRTVRNYNRQELRAIVTATFPFDEDPTVIRQMLEEVCAQIERDYRDEFLADSNGNLIEPPQVYGVTDINENDKGGTFTIIGKTKPGSIWLVEKMMREYIWMHSCQRGIKIAYPRRIYQPVDNQELSKLAADNNN